MDAKKFFDSVAADYNRRYKKQDPRFIFFHERLEYALSNETIVEKSILDVGAGGGQLYHRLRKQNVTYYACDISQEMMKEGNLPNNCSFVINESGIIPSDLKIRHYDYVFMLGLTAYLSENELRSYIDEIKPLLNLGSKVIISFSLNNPLHTFPHRVMKTIARCLPSFYVLKALRSSISGASVTVNRTNVSNICSLDGELLPYSIYYHGLIPSPLNRILGSKINSLLTKLVRRALSSRIKLLSSDCIIKYRYVPS